MSKNNKIVDFLESGEDFPTESVPSSARKSWWSIGMVWTGVYISIAGILDGLAIAGALPFYEGLFALLIGFIIFSIIAVLQGSIGTKTGLSTYMIARESFGLKGSHVVSIVAFLGSFGWYIIQCRALAESIVSLIGFGNIGLISLVCGLLMMITAILGYRGIEALSTPTVIYTFFFMIITATSTLLRKDTVFSEFFARAPLGEQLSFSAGVSIIVGAMAVGAAISPDIMRFSRSMKDNFKAMFIIGLPFSIIQPVSAMILGLASKSSNFGTVMITMGGIWGLIMVVTGAWTSNDNNLYSASLAISEVIGNRIKRWKVSIFLGVTASVLAGFIDLAVYDKIMFIICAFVIPVVGVTISDFYILPKIGLRGGLTLEANKQLNPAALIAWLIGGILQASFDFGIISPIFGIPGVIITILATMLAYTIIMKATYKDTINSWIN
jgi:cytosine permease